MDSVNWLRTAKPVGFTKDKKKIIRPPDVFTKPSPIISI
jgi:hypothetical protein